MSKQTGGPAFPWVAVEPPYYIEEGMALRDWFAGKALQGIEASQGNGGHFISTVEKVAARAYELADAMLKAREES